MEDIEHYGIPVYNFPYDVEEDDEDTIADNSELRVSLSLLVSRSYVSQRFHSRLFFLLPSSAQRKKLRLTDSPFAPAFTHGVSLRSITPSTRTLADSEAHC
jgi:hypothetical protein